MSAKKAKQLRRVAKNILITLPENETMDKKGLDLASREVKYDYDFQNRSPDKKRSTVELRNPTARLVHNKRSFKGILKRVKEIANSGEGEIIANDIAKQYRGK